MKPRVLEPAVAVLCLHLLGERLWWAPAQGRHWFSFAALFAAVSAIALDGFRLAPQRQALDVQVRRVHAQVGAMDGSETRPARHPGWPLEAMLVWNSPLDVRFPSPALATRPAPGMDHPVRGLPRR